MTRLDRLLLMAVSVGVTLLFAAVAILPVEAQPTGLDRYPVYSFSNITTNTTTTVLTGDGVLHAICINNAGASANTATVYDNTAASGTTIATIDTVELNGRCLEYDVDVGTGITVVTATGTAADLTVIYRDLR